MNRIRIAVLIVLAVITGTSLVGVNIATVRAGGTQAPCRFTAKLDHQINRDLGQTERLDELSKIGRKVVYASCETKDPDLEPDAVSHVPEEAPPSFSASAASWGLSAIRSDQANALGFRGQGAVACVADTGANDGPEFTGRIIAGRDWTGKGSFSDGHGHGTHVSGTVLGTTYGVAPAAKLLVAKVLSDQGSGYNSDIEAGIIWCADSGANAINLSLGGYGEGNFPAAVDYARSKGAIVVAAAGNNGVDESMYPAATQGVVGVIATNQNNQRASFSNYGAQYDISAPGESITSVGGAWSGTSMASPHITGVAVLLAGKGVTGQAGESRLFASAVDIYIPGFDPDSGWGRADALNAVSGSSPATPTPVRMTPTRTPSVPRTPTLVPGNFVQQTIAIINQRRADNNLPPLREDARLDAAAQEHSDDMAANGFLDHTGSDGSDPGVRIARQKYYDVGWGETIGGGYQTPEQTVDAWMNSYGHRMILLGNYADIGVGYADNGTYYSTLWTADLANEAGSPPPPTQTQAPDPTRTPTRIPTRTPTRVFLPTVTRTASPPTLTPVPTKTPTPVPSGCTVLISGLTYQQASTIQTNLRAAWIPAAWGYNSLTKNYFVRTTQPDSRVACN